MEGGLGVLQRTIMKELFIQYIVVVIVVWRLTHLISMEDGPFDLIFKCRQLLGASFFGKLMDCFYCLSIWIGIGFAIYFGQHWFGFCMLAFYYSGAAILLEKFSNPNFN